MHNLFLLHSIFTYVIKLLIPGRHTVIARFSALL